MDSTVILQIQCYILFICNHNSCFCLNDISWHWTLILHHLFPYCHLAMERTCTFSFLPWTSAALFPFPSYCKPKLWSCPHWPTHWRHSECGLAFILEDICNKAQITDLSPSQRCRGSFTTSEMTPIMVVTMLWKKYSWCRQLQFHRQTKREQGKKQNHNPRLQQWRLWSVYTSAWQNPMGYSRR